MMRMESSTCSPSISEEKAPACSVDRTRPPSRMHGGFKGKSGARGGRIEERRHDAVLIVERAAAATTRSMPRERSKNSISRGTVNCCDSTTCLKLASTGRRGRRQRGAESWQEFEGRYAS